MMTRFKTMLLIIGVCGVLLISFIVYQWMQPEPLPHDEVTVLVNERYEPSEIQSSTYRNDTNVYEFMFLKDTGQYQLILDATSGSVQSLQLVEQREEPLSEAEIESILQASFPEQIVNISNVTLQENRYVVDYQIDDQSGEAEIDAYTGSIIWNSLEEQQALLTPEEAVELALAEVPGTLDDIEQETLNDRLVYEVEIEDTGRDDDAIVIVDAYSGVIISVIWD
ncbi:PepSY domain-containing protein [Shouchella sp. 1P09AA]|uniref:PepSY domain-containing protein n=2 Tax=unclassified Shouchella TaxID=2893065 RepID=UPI00399EFE26